MKILGIDHATVHAGAAFMDGDKFTYFRALDLKKISNDEPMVTMHRYLNHMLMTSPKVEYVALEKPMALRNGKVARMLIEVYAGVKLAARLNNVPVIEVTPQEVKLYTAGHAQAEKKDVARALVAQFKLDIDMIAPPVYYKTGKKKGQLKERLYDVSDAAALCIAAQQILKRRVMEAG